MSMYEGDCLCNDCFDDRKRSASSCSVQDLLEKNWGLYFVPVIGLGILASRLKKNIFDDCSEVYHVYINGKHEVWHDNRTNEYNKKRCEKCSNYYTYFYQLVDLKN